MHDVDRPQLETDPEWTGEQFEEGEEEQFLGGLLGGILGGEIEPETDEVEEAELASELLEVSDEQELDQFLGDLLKRTISGVGRFVRSPQVAQMGGAVKKDLIKTLKKSAVGVLPHLGKAIAGYAGGEPYEGLGGALGSAAKGGLGYLLGIESEGLSEEDAQFEIAKRYVRFARAATARAVTSPRRGPAPVIVRRAATIAARRHAPGLVQLVAGPGGEQQTRGGEQTGRWYRRGSNIVIDL